MWNSTGGLRILALRGIMTGDVEITYYRKRRRLLPNDATEKVDRTDLAIPFRISNACRKVYIHVDDETKGNFKHGKRRMNSLTSMAHRDDVIKRTIYVSDSNQQVTEEQLAAFFVNRGRVIVVPFYRLWTVVTQRPVPIFFASVDDGCSRTFCYWFINIIMYSQYNTIHVNWPLF